MGGNVTAVLWAGPPARGVAPRLTVPAAGPVRVCHVASADLWAGAEAQIATVASYLARRPDVDLTAVLLNDGPLAGALRSMGIRVTVIEEHRHNAFRILAALTRLLRDDRVQIVHTHRYKENVLGALAARLAGVPCIVRTVHGRGEPMTGWPRVKFRAYEALDTQVLRHLADGIVAVSQSVADGLERAGCRRRSIVHLRNGVDLANVRAARARDAVRRELAVPPDAPLIGTVGRLTAVKGHVHFLRAARLILDEEPAARFLVVGDGPLRDELVAAAASVHIDHACMFAGARTDVYDLVAAMDVFVLPSLDEGIPMALLEAMALGTPVVASAVGGVPEVVTPRVTGLLVPPRNERELSEACLELARDRMWARTIGARARRNVEDEFSHETCGAQLVDLYRSVTAGLDAGDEAPAAGSAPRRAAAPMSGWVLARGLLTHGARKVRTRLRHLREQRRMQRVRRRPRALAAALRSARAILIVCHGNIIRSPFAARLVEQALGADAAVSIVSGGLAATPGKPSPDTAVRVAADSGIDLTDHRASALTAEAVAASDVILVMDVPQLLAMRARYPDARDRTFLLTCLAPGAPLEVRDPVDGDTSVFASCFDHIAACVRPIVSLLSNKAPSRFHPL